MNEQIPPVIDHPRMILGAVGLAMGIAVFVLSFLGKMDASQGLPLLAIGVICFGISSLLPRK